MLLSQAILFAASRPPLIVPVYLCQMAVVFCWVFCKTKGPHKGRHPHLLRRIHTVGLVIVRGCGVEMGSGGGRRGWEGDWRGRVRYWLAEHPRVAEFRWDHDEWCSTWVFLVMSIFVYLAGILLLKLALRKRKRAIPLGPIPAIHNSMVIIGCVGVFMGCWEATAVEIEMGWVWRKAKAEWNWIICFPLGTRPSGRVFFWSYIFYLTKYHQLFHTAIHILQRKPLTFLHVFHRIFVVFMCFVWLEFSQSLQIVAILGNTVVCVMIYSYKLCKNVGLRWPLPLPSPVKCQMAECVFTVVAYAALLSIHFRKREGCNGMGAWLFNALFNAALLLLFLDFYAKRKATPPSAPGPSFDSAQHHKQCQQ